MGEKSGSAICGDSCLFMMQIFLDMAVLVDAQGDMLDNIEAQVG